MKIMFRILVLALFGYAGNANAADRYQTRNFEEIRSLICSLLQIPYIMTLDSKDVVNVRLASLAAALGTCTKDSMKLVEKQNDKRFCTTLLWDTPKFIGYTTAAYHDLYNTFYADMMLAERHASKVNLTALKKDQLMFLAVEILLRGLTLFIDAKMENSAMLEGRWLKTLSALMAESADIIELWRLLSRLRTSMGMPGVEIGCKVDISHKPDSNPDKKETEADLLTEAGDDQEDFLEEFVAIA